MKRSQLKTKRGRIMNVAVAPMVLVLSMAAPAVSQTRLVNAVPGAAVSTAGAPTPNGVKVLARVPLDGQAVTRMYTQWESGRSYLYIEHGRQQLTALDVTRKKNPHIVSHEPAQLEPARYEELAEGGTIEVSTPSQVSAGFDNLGGRGMFSILEASNSDDAALLQAFGRNTSNLADRDRNLVFFASPTQLVIVEDDRWKGFDYIN